MSNYNVQNETNKNNNKKVEINMSTNFFEQMSNFKTEAKQSISVINGVIESVKEVGMYKELTIVPSDLPFKVSHKVFNDILFIIDYAVTTGVVVKNLYELVGKPVTLHKQYSEGVSKQELIKSLPVGIYAGTFQGITVIPELETYVFKAEVNGQLVTTSFIIKDRKSYDRCNTTAKVVANALGLKDGVTLADINEAIGGAILVKRVVGNDGKGVYTNFEKITNTIPNVASDDNDGDDTDF